MTHLFGRFPLRAGSGDLHSRLLDDAVSSLIIGMLLSSWGNSSSPNKGEKSLSKKFASAQVTSSLSGLI